MAIAPSDLDANQIIQGAYDEPNQALRVEAISGGGGIVTSPWDYIAVNTAGSTADIYTYKLGGSGGSTVNTVTLTYTDSTKTTLSSVAKT